VADYSTAAYNPSRYPIEYWELKRTHTAIGPASTHNIARQSGGSGFEKPQPDGKCQARINLIKDVLGRLLHLLTRKTSFAANAHFADKDESAVVANPGIALRYRQPSYFISTRLDLRRAPLPRDLRGAAESGRLGCPPSTP